MQFLKDPRIRSFSRWSINLAATFSLLLATLLSQAGCQRSAYRQQADEEAYYLIEQKATDPRWPLADYRIDIDPRSRMFDPFDADRPPMPWDDPTSHEYMHSIDGKRGYPRWHENGDTQIVESPDWKSYLPLDENGSLVLDSDESIRQALIHSRDYQRQFETLYLSALDVSAERFRFDTQFFGGYGADYTGDGRARFSPAGNDTSTLGLSTSNVQLRKMSATGGELVVGLANSLVWQFSGPDTHSASTIVDFTLLQPLLRRAGRDRVLESLTSAERGLLSNVRQMERYRRGFALSVAVGGSPPVGSARGGVSGTAAIGRIGGGGFLGLLETTQNIRNQETEVASLRSSLALMEAFSEAGRIDFIQMENTRQSLYQGQSRLLNAKNGYQQSLDNFKQTLGLPPRLNVVITDPLLDRFNLIEPEATQIQNTLSEVQTRTGNIIVQILPEDIAQTGVIWSDDLKKQLGQLRQYVIDAEMVRKRLVASYIPQIYTDIENLEKTLPKRRENALAILNSIALRLEEEKQNSANKDEATAADVDPSLFYSEDLDQLPADLVETIVNLEERLAEIKKDSKAALANIEEILASGESLEPEKLLEELRLKVFSLIPANLTELSADLIELSLVQARARAESLTLTPIEMDSVTATNIASRNRRDWMNARADLVDSWRLIEFTADDLESNLSIVFSGDIQNTGDNPIRLRTTTGRLRVGVQFDAPFTRLIERNTYRQSLIEFQQAKRDYYTLTDTIERNLRTTLRQAELNKADFELQRIALRIAVAQVQSVRLELQRPPALNQRQGAGPTTANNLIGALRALRNAQDGLLGVWVSSEIQRRSLDFDLGTMELDSEGIWIDPGPIGVKYGYPEIRDEDPLDWQCDGCTMGPRLLDEPFDFGDASFELQEDQAESSQEGTAKQLSSSLLGPLRSLLSTIKGGKKEPSVADFEVDTAPAEGNYEKSAQFGEFEGVR